MVLGSFNGTHQDKCQLDSLMHGIKALVTELMDEGKAEALHFLGTQLLCIHYAPATALGSVFSPVKPPTRKLFRE